MTIERVILGGAFVVAGILLIAAHAFFHDRILRFNNAFARNNPLLRDMWTGKYTRGGLIALRVAGILFGLFFLTEGVFILAGVVD